MLNPEKVTVIGRYFSLWIPETDTNAKAAVGSYFELDANVVYELLTTIWLWLTYWLCYWLLRIQGETCSPLRYVVHCLKTTFRVKLECGILFQMQICLGTYKKTLKSYLGFSWLTVSTEALSSTHVNLLATGTCVVYRWGFQSPTCNGSFPFLLSCTITIFCC